MTDLFAGLSEKLRALEAAVPPGPPASRPADEVRLYLRETRLTLQRKAAAGELGEPVQRFTRAEGKIQVEDPVKPAAVWSLRWRRLKCGKAGAAEASPSQWAILTCCGIIAAP